MSNRLIGIFIIIGFIGVGYLYYNLNYLPEKELIVKQELEKNIVEKVKNPELVKQSINTIELSNLQKIEKIKEKNNSYKIFDLDYNNKVYFKENNNSLDLFIDSDKIGNFNIVYSEYLRVELIKGSNKDLYIEVGADKFYYNNKRKDILKIELNIDIDYVKVGSNNRLIFVTEKGSFIYSIFDKSLDYFSYFNDFVYFNYGYIGLVQKDEKRRLNNLGFESNNKNLIVYYNPSTKEKKIIYETDLNIKNIYINNNKIYLVNNDDEIFELENI